MKIFISSLINNMESQRVSAATAINDLGHEPIRAESYPASPDSPQSACLSGVRDSDLVILILGEKYGFIQDSGLSATHEEYREAKERKPVLAFIQTGVDFDKKQSAFVEEVQDWSSGQYTASFEDLSSLRSTITRSIHEWELSQASGPIDSEQTLSEALSLFAVEEVSYGGLSPQLWVVVSGAPTQSILRPSELENKDLIDWLQREALFGKARVFNNGEGIKPSIKGHNLILKQLSNSVLINERGTISVRVALGTTTRGMMVIIEEDLLEKIICSLKYTSSVLDHIDSQSRISHVVIAAAVVNANYFAWKTRAEHHEHPNTASINMTEPQVKHFNPPHKPRGSLRMQPENLAEDILALLKRGVRT